ncbi:hypothetical protein B0H67DRAFT_559496 [Lasiosphaeris hirsuta]|uniref:Secreted protein n=1 Tax=Lasiosphaeris hirsuta TaxID=260670 RepID=A0AA40E7F1_9PEZI|nr:hypothetical protein B0H67DRAFT_559496 [Lasiosphaeris hirsuta]
MHAHTHGALRSEAALSISCCWPNGRRALLSWFLFLFLPAIVQRSLATEGHDARNKSITLLVVLYSDTLPCGG